MDYCLDKYNARFVKIVIIYKKLIVIYAVIISSDAIFSSMWSPSLTIQFLLAVYY